jgi:hypothetical protein
LHELRTIIVLTTENRAPWRSIWGRAPTVRAPRRMHDDSLPHHTYFAFAAQDVVDRSL